MCFLLRCFSSLFHLFVHAYSVYMRHHNANIVFSRSWFLFKLYNVVVVNMLQCCLLGYCSKSIKVVLICQFNVH